MAILEQVQIPTQTPQAVVNSNVRRPFGGFQVADRPQAKVWGNWAIIMGGEPVPLPVGQPIDTMAMASTTGTNLAVVRLNHKKNKFLAALHGLGNKMQPGETKVVGDASREGSIVCILRRVSDELEIAKEDGDLDVDGIMGLLTSNGGSQGNGEAKKPLSPATQQMLDAPSDTGESMAEMEAHLKQLQKAIKAAKAAKTDLF